MSYIKEGNLSQRERYRSTLPKPTREAFYRWYGVQLELPLTDPMRLRAEAGRRFLEKFDQHVLYSDEDVLAITKPVHISTHGNGKLPPYGIAELSKIATGNPDVYTVHRLDMDTSGVLTLGKNKASIANLNSQFDRTKGSKEVKKKYVALVQGRWSDAISGTVLPLTRRDDGKGVRVVEEWPDPLLTQASEPACTDPSEAPKVKISATGMNVIARLMDENTNPWTLLSLNLLTGRTHQIRVSTSYLGYPILGDPLYGQVADSARGQLLHAYELSLLHPGNEERLTFRAGLPRVFRQKILGMAHADVQNEIYYKLLKSGR